MKLFSRSVPIPIEPRPLAPRAAGSELVLPTPRRGEILPPGASRRPRWRSALTAIPAWLIFGYIWWRALVDEQQQLYSGAMLWATCVALTGVVILAWVAWNRALSRHRIAEFGGRKLRASGPIDFSTDALGRPVVVAEGAPTSRLLEVDLVDGVKMIGPATAPN